MRGKRVWRNNWIQSLSCVSMAVDSVCSAVFRQRHWYPIEFVKRHSHGITNSSKAERTSTKRGLLVMLECYIIYFLHFTKTVYCVLVVFLHVVQSDGAERLECCHSHRLRFHLSCKREEERDWGRRGTTGFCIIVIESKHRSMKSQRNRTTHLFYSREEATEGWASQSL